MHELTLEQVEAVGGARLEEAAIGMAALGGALALAPFAIAAAVAIGGAVVLETMYVEGM
jgi:hypothetical protein